MSAIPRTDRFDSTLDLFAEGYRFISNRCERYETDLFATRLALRKVVCMRGAEAAEIFYGGDRFTRRGAMPPNTLRLLQDKGSVQLMDGTDHRARKAMFMEVLAPERSGALADEVEREWRASVPRWAREEEDVVLHEAVRGVLCRAACAWAGVPLEPGEAERRTRELGAMIDAAGSFGPRNWWAQLLRRRCERWGRDLVEEVRSGGLDPTPGSPLAVVALHRGPDGERLSREVASVELINLLRPTVAIARFVVFAALALHENPDQRKRVAEGDEPFRRSFVQEVRRFYPFFPMVGGRVREPFEWRGHPFGENDWILFDLYGTNRDPAVWRDPEQFRPGRFDGREANPWTFVPQGAGDHGRSHRCPGEWATIDIIGRCVALLAGAMRYRVPEQDLTIDLTEMPALPGSGFVIRDVQEVPARE